MNPNRPMRTFAKALLLVIIAALALAAKPVPEAHAATFTVTKTADTNDGACDADCSLREAIIAANSNPGGDTIILPSGVYILTITGRDENNSATGDLDIQDTLIINGAGAANTIIDGNNLDRVIDANPNGGVGVQLEISGVTIRHGQPALDLTPQNGGGIRNAGALTLTASIIFDNRTNGQGGGIYNSAGNTVTFAYSTIISNQTPINGGGIVNSMGGTVTLNNSSIVSNTTGYQGGGGLLNVGSMRLSAVTVTGNTGGVGGGITNGPGVMTIVNSTLSGNGGGLNNFGTLTLVNSTVSGNSSYGGITNSGMLTITNSTISSNTTNSDGGGIAVGGGGTLTMINSILAGNMDLGGNAPDCHGPLASGGHNLIQSTTGCTISGDTTGNLTGVNPLLGPLQNNGGSTFTQALLPGSPAIDAGNPTSPGSGGNTCEATDQRGVARPQGTRCDMGAFEALQVQFNSSAFSVNENAGTAIITVTLSAPPALTATVSYTTSNGNALAGSDYLMATGALTFTSGVTAQTFIVPIMNDLLDETDETVTLTLGNPGNAVPGTPQAATLTIVDDDPPPVLQFDSSAFSVNENAGTAIITVTLGAPSALTVTVNYATSDGTATANSDYTPISGTLTLAPGQISQTFSVAITDDMLDEPDETAILILSNPFNVSLGLPNPATLTIIDDDVPLYKLYLPLMLR